MLLEKLPYIDPCAPVLLKTDVFPSDFSFNEYVTALVDDGLSSHTTSDGYALLIPSLAELV